MKILANFIDSIKVNFSCAAFREVQTPFFLNGFIDKHNFIIMLNKGNMFVGENNLKIPEKSFCLFPAGQPIYIKHGKGNHSDLGPEGFTDNDHRSEFIRKIHVDEDMSSIKEFFTIVSFDALLYEAIPFFEILEIPPFSLPEDIELDFLVRHITCEYESNKIGRNKIIENYIDEIMIHIFRFLDANEGFNKYIEKLNFLTDKRLVDIIRYVRQNLDKDLSNKSIAKIAFISEDYVGQFFKSMTGKNLQDYIENQRLEKAFFLLKTQPDNVQEIAHKVGFKDPAYFSRRFKMKFGSNANTIRSSKNHII